MNRDNNRNNNDGNNNEKGQGQEQIITIINEGSRNKQQLHHAFRLFVRFVSTKYKPLVIVLDDLQWADIASLEVIEILVTDQDNHNHNHNKNGGLLVVGCYRSSSNNNEIHEEESQQVHSKFIRDLKEKSSNISNSNNNNNNININVVEIELGTLSLEQTNQVIRKLLSISSSSNSYNNNCDDDDDDDNIDNDTDHSQQVQLQQQQQDDENRRIQQLATICHRRTEGNPYFLISFLMLLHREEYIQFNLGLLSWDFDINKIENETASALNVVEMMMEKMMNCHTVDQNLKRLLQIASLLGSRFDFNIVSLIWKELYYHHNDDANNKEEGVEEEKKVFEDESMILKQCLDQAIGQSFFEVVGQQPPNNNNNIRYQWVHDSLSEAAMSLIPESDQPTFKFKVGMILYENLKHRQELLDSFIFVIVNLLNSSSKSSNNKEEECLLLLEEDGMDNMEIARLCAKAAIKARNLSAFGSTAKYASIGIDHMTRRNDNNNNNNNNNNNDDNKWTTNYDLALELYCAAAESECVLGGDDSKKIQVYADEVLEKGRTILDKVPVYYVLALAFGKMGQFVNSNKICIDAINQLKVIKIPRSGLILASRTISGLFSTKNLLTSKTADSFPFMKDANQIATMKLLDLTCSYAFQANNVILLLFATVQMIRLSIKHGISSSSPSAFAMYGGLCFGVLNDLKAAVHIGEMALAMVNKLKGQQANESLVIARTSGFMLGYSRPSHDALKEFLHGYNVGMKFGDTEMSSWCLYNHAACSLFAGKSLRTIEEDCRIYVAHMQDLGWTIVAEATLYILLTVVFLIGNEDEESFSDLFAAVDGEPRFSDLSRFMCRSVAYAYTGNYEEGAEYAIGVGDAVRKAAPGHMILQSDVFTRGVCLYAMARETNKQKYKKPARAIRKIIKTWIKQGSVNLKHQVCLLNAEEEAIRGRDMDKASKLYREGIVDASRRGFLRDVGLIHERYANFLLHDLRDRYQARHHAEQSILRYEEWGALRTGEMLKSKYSDLLADEVPPSVHMSIPPSSAALSALERSMELTIKSIE